MSDTAELNATEIATRLLPLLKEYAAKMATLAETGSSLLEKLAHVHREAKPPSALEAGRLICLHDTLEKPVTDLAREASGIIEHSAIEYHLRGELKLRLDELEEHIRFSAVVVGQVIDRIAANKAHSEWVRQLIEKSGRYKAPF